MDFLDLQPYLMQKFVQFACVVVRSTMGCVGKDLPHLLNRDEELEQFPDDLMSI